MSTLWSYLVDEFNYVNIIKKIDDNTFSDIEIIALANHLATSIRSKQYKFSQPKLFIYDNQKNRSCFKYELNDSIVSKAIYIYLTNLFTKNCSKNVYSFIPGRNFIQGVRNFLNFMTKHINEDGQLDLWVVKLDIKRCGASIPVHATSNLWLRLENLLKEDQSFLDNSYLQALLVETVRPLYFLDDKLIQNIFGLPTGSAIANLMLNLYLSPLDSMVDNYTDIFYIRYGDDILIAGKNKNQVIQFEKELLEQLRQLGLTPHPDKYQRMYLSKNGYQKTISDEFKATNSFSFLGHIIYAHGTTQPSHRSWCQFVSGCRSSINVSFLSCKHLSLDEQGKIICQGLKQDILHLDEKALLSFHNNCNLILRANDHHYLQEVDRIIALMIAEKLSGVKGRKAFRYIPYQKIREKWQLPSLVTMVNTFYKNKKTPSI